MYKESNTLFMDMNSIFNHAWYLDKSLKELNSGYETHISQVNTSLLCQIGMLYTFINSISSRFNRSKQYRIPESTIYWNNVFIIPNIVE